MNAVNPSGWRPEAPQAGGAHAPATATGNRALMLEERLLFEIGKRDQCGVDFEDTAKGAVRIGNLARNGVDQISNRRACIRPIAAPPTVSYRG